MQIVKKTDKIRKKLLTAVAFMLLLTVLTVPGMQAKADNMIIRLSDKDLKIGENLTVTVSVPAGISASVTVNYPTSLLTFVKASEETSENAGTIVLSVGEYGSRERGTETITFQTKASGNAGIAVAATKATDSSGNQVSVPGASTIVKIGNETVENHKSADSSLSSLSVSDGTLSPAFSGNVFAYKLNVENSVSSLKVGAVAKDSNAKVESVVGADSLAVGTNTVKVNVRAEDGTTSVYTIEVTRAEAEQQEEQPAAENTGEEGKEEETAEAGEKKENIRLKSEFGYITLLTKADTDILPEGYEPKTLTIPEKGDVTAYFCDSNPDICLLYAKNEQGEQAWYQYDIKERTYLRWYGQELTAASSKESGTADQIRILSLESENRILFWAFVATVAVLLVMILFLVLKRGRKSGDEDGTEPINLDGIEAVPEKNRKAEPKKPEPEKMKPKKPEPKKAEPKKPEYKKPEPAVRKAEPVTDEISEIQAPRKASPESKMTSGALPSEEQLLQQIGEETTKDRKEKNRSAEKKRWRRNKVKNDEEEDDGLEFIDL